MRAKANTRGNSRLAPHDSQRSGAKDETPYTKYMQTHYSNNFLAMADSQISIMSSGFHQRGEDPQIAVLKDEAEKTPILRLVQSERSGADEAQNRKAVSKQLDKNSFTPVLHDTWLKSAPAVTLLAKTQYSANPAEGSLGARPQDEITLTEDRLRRTFRRSQSFSSKNRETCRRGVAGARSSERVKKRKFPDILQNMKKVLPKIRELEPTNHEELTAHDREVNAHCQRLIQAMMQKHNVNCLDIRRCPWEGL
jgi:hypothetical protein